MAAMTIRPRMTTSGSLLRVRSEAKAFIRALGRLAASVLTRASICSVNRFTGGGCQHISRPIRVYLMRSAARRNETADYTLTVGITGGAAAAPALGAARAGDAKVEGTPYHAIGQVPCSMGMAPRGSAQCDFDVIRGKPGNAEVHVTPPGGFKRVLTFVAGKVTTDSGTGLKATKTGDLWSVDVDDYEHYRIPDAVISGG